MGVGGRQQGPENGGSGNDLELQSVTRGGCFGAFHMWFASTSIVCSQWLPAVDLSLDMGFAKTLIN